MEIGSRIGPYEIKERIGEGGMATVYKAWHLGLHRFEAVKVPRQQYLNSDSEFIQRLLSEARISAQLHHPHIVAIHNVSEVDAPQQFFAMDLVVGYDLAKLLERRECLPIAEVLPILRQIGSALDYAHAHGVIHRDIKPGNILLQEVSEQGGWMAKVVDFGISRAAEDTGGTKLTKNGMIIGTPEYMSPEQAGNGDPVDYRTDIYSLGIVAYEMLCGRVPFLAGEGVSQMSILMSHVRSTPRPPVEQIPDLPLAANNAVLKALAKHPSDRFSSCADFTKALSGAVTVTPPPVTEDQWPASLAPAITPSAAPSVPAAAESVVSIPPVASNDLSSQSAPASNLGAANNVTANAAAPVVQPTANTSSTASSAPVPSPVETPVTTVTPEQTPPVPVVKVRERTPFDAKPGQGIHSDTKKGSGSANRSNLLPWFLGLGGVAIVLLLAATVLRRQGPAPVTGDNSAPIALATPTSAQIATVPTPESSPLALASPTATSKPTIRPAPTPTLNAAGQRVTHLRDTQPISFPHKVVKSPTLPEGQKRVTQQGKPGVREINVEIVYKGIREVSRRTTTKVLKAPVPEIVTVGGILNIDPVSPEEARQAREGGASGVSPRRATRIRRRRRTVTHRSHSSRPVRSQRTSPRVAPPVPDL